MGVEEEEGALFVGKADGELVLEGNALVLPREYVDTDEGGEMVPGEAGGSSGPSLLLYFDGMRWSAEWFKRGVGS